MTRQLVWYFAGLVAPYVAGLVIGVITDRSRSLWPSVVTHGAGNRLHAMRRGSMLTVRIGTVVVASVFALAGCGGSDGSSSGGPAEVSDGAYAFLASSAGGSAPATTLTIASDTLTLAGEAGPVTATIGEPAAEAVLCPPSGTGQPATVSAPLTVGSVALASPALFGDCGQTTPKRVTLVDLDSYDEAGGPLKYTRWVEFCNTTDPDCQSPEQ